MVLRCDAYQWISVRISPFVHANQCIRIGQCVLALQMTFIHFSQRSSFIRKKSFTCVDFNEINMRNNDKKNPFPLIKPGPVSAIRQVFFLMQHKWTNFTFAFENDDENQRWKSMKMTTKISNENRSRLFPFISLHEACCCFDFITRIGKSLSQ